METKSTDFFAIRLKLASPEEILSWSRGEVTKPETINYRTQKPEKDGLFCERIFGPEKDWECYCGKYRRIRYKGVICDKCGVEVTRAVVRRERMGHIKLASPVSHIWFLRGVPSKIGLLLNVSVQDLERVVYFTSYIIVNVNEEARVQALAELESEYKSRSRQATQEEKEKNRRLRDEAREELKKIHKHQIISEAAYRNLSLKYAHVFEAGTGAESLNKLLCSINLNEMKELLKKELKNESSQKRKILRQLRLVEGMIKAGIRPEWMISKIIPIIPPDLRPMVQLDGGRYATSDINDLYRRVINRNNRLKKLLEFNAPEVIIRNEKRMLQEAVDALIDNSASSIRHNQVGVAASTGQRRPLKSLADILKGKQGRFRQNLLGKRVDYSARSVIVIGPELNLNQCGLPKKMALELFKPFVIRCLIERELAHNIRGAGRLIEQETTEVWEILEEVIRGKYVLLNRAPTLHRLGIQAFQPILIEGNAIQIPAMVCSAFNADFDGDQMAVHLPLSAEAQLEAATRMIPSNNLLKPSTGEPIMVPTQDIVLGCFWMTRIRDGMKGEGKIFGTPDEAIMAYQLREIHMNARIKFLLRPESGKGEIIETCVGRIMFNEILPAPATFINEELRKKTLIKIVARLIEEYGKEKTAVVLNKIKDLGFKYATHSGISWGMDDIKEPELKSQIVKEAEKHTEIIREQYNQGLLTEEERRLKVIEVWLGVVNKISEEVPKGLDPAGSVPTIVSSGSRGTWTQINQMAGMKGLVTNPAGEIIELPVKSSFKSGFSALEYFISTHGARKGAADTALRTATAGYLTRRLVDVAQDVVVRSRDCGDDQGVSVWTEDGKTFGRGLGDRLVGRVVLDDIKDDKKIVIGAGTLIGKEMIKDIDILSLDKVKVRSVISCRARGGVCQLCYGYDLGKNELVDIGEAVGIVTAQAIGEPGTQLTMRTFHTGGVAGGTDITMGLPRVEEIFEARVPKGKAMLAEHDGVVDGLDDGEKQRVLKITYDLPPEKRNEGVDGELRVELGVPPGIAILVKKGDKIEKGRQLTDGNLDPQELYRLSGREAVERYVIREVQSIYSTAGENIADKHIELIIRQMFSRVKIKEEGDTNLLFGDVYERDFIEEKNDQMRAENKKPISFEPILLGITRVSLSTSSFLSAASFIETARVLINAAMEGREDHLRGLKENVIIGKLIPAGTGYVQREQTKTL